MVPFTIFHRLSSLGSGGGVNAGTISSRSKDAASGHGYSITLRDA
jgi:hypothetical protein